MEYTFYFDLAMKANALPGACTPCLGVIETCFVKTDSEHTVWPCRTNEYVSPARQVCFEGMILIMQPTEQMSILEVKSY